MGPLSFPTLLGRLESSSYLASKPWFLSEPEELGWGQVSGSSLADLGPPLSGS